MNEFTKRNCVENIKVYKDELKKLKYIQNPYNVTTSYSNIEKQVSWIGENIKKVDLSQSINLYKKKTAIMEIKDDSHEDEI
jgi:hypothetical protein